MTTTVRQLLDEKGHNVSTVGITPEEADARKVAGVLSVSREQARVMVRQERRADMVALNSSID
jgi:hypothetical protein